MNTVILIGNLVDDPKLTEYPPREGQDEPRVKCSFKLAVNRNGQDAGADFIFIGVWNGSAKACADFLSKGSRVAVRGRLNTNSKQQDDGTWKDYTEVVADPGYGVEFLNTRRSDEAQTVDNDPSDTREAVAVGATPTDDDIPF